MANGSGLRYFSLDVGAENDPKVTALVGRRADPATCTMLEWNRAVSEVMGTLVRLWGEVYRCGYALELTEIERGRMAMTLGMAREEFDAFVDDAVAVGLFDAGVYESDGALMSARTVANYLASTKQSADSLGDDVPQHLRPAKDEGQAAQRRQPRKPAERPRRAPKTSEDSREVPRSSENLREVPKTSEDSREVPKMSAEIEREIEREKKKSSSSAMAGFGEDVPTCMLVPNAEEGVCYADDAGGLHDTPAAALEQIYLHKTGLLDFPDFLAHVGRHCPKGCRASPEQVRACCQLVEHALERYDPSRGTSPLPLTLRIIEQDRGW